MQEQYGNTVIGSLSSANPCPDKVCHRTDCKLCLSGPSNSKCFTNNIGYRISCNRSPCNKYINNNQLKDEQVRKQLEEINPDRQPDSKPAIYEGQTFRSAYTRSKQHWQKYTNKSGQKTSVLWHHTQTDHGGQIGHNKGAEDYKFAITQSFRNNLSRQTDEGKRQTVLETFQQQQKVQVLNSKTDFCQPLRTKLTVINKNTNKELVNTEDLDKPAPFQTDNTQQTTPFTPTQTSTPNKTTNTNSVTTTQITVIPHRLQFSPVRAQPAKKVRFDIDSVD